MPGAHGTALRQDHRLRRPAAARPLLARRRDLQQSRPARRHRRATSQGHRGAGVGVRPAGGRRHQADVVVEPAGLGDQRRGGRAPRRALRPHRRGQVKVRHLGTGRCRAARRAPPGGGQVRRHDARRLRLGHRRELPLAGAAAAPGGGGAHRLQPGRHRTMAEETRASVFFTARTAVRCLRNADITAWVTPPAGRLRDRGVRAVPPRRSRPPGRRCTCCPRTAAAPPPRWSRR